tara:strand:+ start:2211 stop:3335 length:1125 start_codon:yes stop_codon:yes gene_type:complete
MDLTQRILYHQVQPQATQTSYTARDQVDFLISVGEGRSLVPNSVRILGDLQVNETGSTVSTGGIRLDPNVGAHAFLDSVNTNMSSVGNIENLQNYPRYVAMDAAASLNELDMCNGSNQCELRAPTVITTTDYCQGITSDLTTGTDPTNNVDFSIKPMCCLNKMDSRSSGLPMERSGMISLQLILASNQSALYGQKQDAATNYVLTNLRCTFKSVVDNKDNQPVVMQIINNFKTNILSGTATISTNVDAVCDSVSVNFIENSRESVNVFNTYELQNIKGLAEVEYIFNSQTNSLITYPIRDTTEMLERFISSMRNTSHNQVSVDKFRANQAFALGLDFEEPVSLVNNRFTMQLTSTVDAGNALNAFLYFHSRRAI